MHRLLRLLMVGLLLFLTSGCAAADNSAQGSNTNYQETKRMMVDLLKSDEGKKAINDILKNDDAIKQEILMKQDFIKSTIEKTLSSDQGKEYWTLLIEDPKFSTNLAKTMQKEDKKVLKQLMSDPTYQKMLMDVLKSPDMEKNYLDLMKTEPYRKQMQSVLIDTMSSPLVAPKLASALQKAIEDTLKKDAKKSQGGSGGKKGNNSGGSGQ